CELFRREGIRRGAATVITQVLVDEHDPEMTHPTKPIGSFYTHEEVGHIQREKPHWIIREIEPGQFRRVVASPRPIRILEEQAIAWLAWKESSTRISPRAYWPAISTRTS